MPISLSSELKSSLKELESVFNLNVSLVLLSILLIFSLFNIESTFCKLLAFSILSLSILLNSLLDISFKLTVSSFDKLFVLNILDDKSSSLEPIWVCKLDTSWLSFLFIFIASSNFPSLLALLSPFIKPDIILPDAIAPFFTPLAIEVNPLAVDTAPFIPIYPALTMLQPLLTPLSIPNILSIKFGPSITAIDAPISNTNWVIPFAFSDDQEENSKYIFKRTDIENSTIKFDTIYLITSFNFWPFAISANEYKRANSFTNPNSNIILETLNTVAKSVIVVQESVVKITKKSKLYL